MSGRTRHHGKSDRPSGRGGDTFHNNWGSRNYHDWDNENYSVKLPKTNNSKKKGEKKKN